MLCCLARTTCQMVSLALAVLSYERSLTCPLSSQFVFHALQIPEIAYEYGKQLEFKGEYNTALTMYQESQRAIQASGASADLLPTVSAGLARMLLRTGDLRNGLALANASTDKQLQRDCAAILEA